MLVGGIAASAAAMLVFSLPAQADEMEDMGGVSISGSMQQDIGFGSWTTSGSSQAASMDDVHFETNAEFVISASGVTDGGLTVTATIEVDGDTAGIDESRMSIAGGFGEISLGAEDNAGNMHGNKGIGGGYAGAGYYDGGDNYTPASSPAPIPNSDAVGIRYSTPSIGGLQAGVSFQPDATMADQATGTSNNEQVIAVGANFSGDFAGTTLTIGANYASQAPVNNTPALGMATPTPSTGHIANLTRKAWGIGVSAGIGATELHVRYDHKGDTHFNGMDTQNVVPMASRDRGNTTSFGIGVDHTVGALKFGIGYGMSKQEDAAADFASLIATDHDDDANTANAVASTSAKDRIHSVLAVGAKYDLGGGVTISGAIVSGKIKNAAGDTLCYGPTGTTTDPVVPVKAPASLGTRGNISPGANTCEGAMTTGDSPTDVQGDALATTLRDINDVGVGLRIAMSF